MTASPYASDAKIAEACAAIGADLIGQTEQTLLQQLVVAAATGGGSAPSGIAWGSITGTLGDQTDLQAALDAKLNLSGGSLTAAVSVPTAAGYPLADARSNGVMFGASPAAADIGISSSNNGLNFYVNGQQGIYHDILAFRFDSNVWLGWSAGTPGGPGSRTMLSGALADATLQIGKASATPIDQTFKGPNGSGTNIAGGDIRVAPGQSTGNATPATVVLQGTAAGSSGATEQTLVDVLTVVREGVIRITNIPTSSAGLSAGDIYSNAGILTIV